MKRNVQHETSASAGLQDKNHTVRPYVMGAPNSDCLLSLAAKFILGCDLQTFFPWCDLYFLALSVACTRFMFSKTSLASS